MSKTFDMNYLHFEENTLTNVLGSPNKPTFAIDGFVKVKILNNVFANNGRYLSSMLSLWTFVDNYHAYFFDALTGFCQPNANTADPQGFLKISYGMRVYFLNNSVTNHFYSFGTANLAPSYGSFVSFSNIKGYVDFTDLIVSNITGLLGDYNVNTLTTIATLTRFNDDVLSYQFIPVITTDTTNNIIEMTLSNITFKDSAAYLGGSDYEGLLLNFDVNLNTQYLDVRKVTIDNLISTNVYIYGQGGMIYKYGDLEITNSEITSFGLTQPKASTEVPENSPIISIIRHDHKLIYNNVTFTNSVGGTDGASIFINAVSSSTVSAITGNNIEMTDVTLNGCKSTGPIMKLNTNTLTGQINNLNADGNSNTVDGVIYISGGGTLVFNNQLFNNNNGVTASDFNIVACTS